MVKFTIGHPAAQRQDVGLCRWLAWKVDGPVYAAMRAFVKAHNYLSAYAVYGRWGL